MKWRQSKTGCRRGDASDIYITGDAERRQTIAGLSSSSYFKSVFAAKIPLATAKSGKTGKLLVMHADNRAEDYLSK